jgi:hypothetical protein
MYLLLLLSSPDRPEVIGEVSVGNVCIGHGEISLHPPPCAPRIPHDEPLLRVIVPHGNDSMAADDPFVWFRHVHHAALRHLLGLKGLVHRKTEHKGKSLRQAGAHLVERADPVIGRYLMGWPFLSTRRRSV